MGIINRNEIRRLEKAAREKDKKYLVEWAYQYDNQMRLEYDRAYREEIDNSINTFLTAVAYTAHFSEETHLGKKKLPQFMEDLFVTVNMFRTGEYTPEEYREELEKNGIYQDSYDYTRKVRKIITIVGTLEEIEAVRFYERKLTLEGYMVFTNVLYQENTEDVLEVYKNKIRISDELFIINEKQIITEEMQKEIEYAKSLKKVINYMKEVGRSEEN